MKGICLAFFSLSTSEQEEVVVVVVVVGGGGVGRGGLWVTSLPPYTRCKFRSLLPVSRLSQLVFVFFFVCLFFLRGGQGRGAGAGAGGVREDN